MSSDYQSYAMKQLNIVSCLLNDASSSEQQTKRLCSYVTKNHYEICKNFDCSVCPFHSKENLSRTYRTVKLLSLMGANTDSGLEDTNYYLFEKENSVFHIITLHHRTEETSAITFDGQLKIVPTELVYSEKERNEWIENDRLEKNLMEDMKSVMHNSGSEQEVIKALLSKGWFKK